MDDLLFVDFRLKPLSSYSTSSEKIKRICFILIIVHGFVLDMIFAKTKMRLKLYRIFTLSDSPEIIPILTVFIYLCNYVKKNINNMVAHIQGYQLKTIYQNVAEVALSLKHLEAQY